MATTFRVIAKDTICALNKSMLAIMNGGASAQVLSVRRIWICNEQLVAMTGVMLTIELRLITALTAAGTKITPQRISGSTSLDANVTCYSGGTPTETSLFRRVLLSADEPKQSSNTQDEFNMIPNWNLIWDAGFIDSNIEPLTCNATQGITIKNTTNTSAPSIGKIMLEFTI